MNPSIPDDLQLDFLRAALLPDVQSFPAFVRWKSQVDFENLDSATTRLLPLLYLNLKRNQIDDPLLPRLRGVYRYTWVKNQRQQLAAHALATEFLARGIPLLFFKGLPLVTEIYDDQGSRQMQDIDLLIPLEQRSVAFNILLESGYTPECEQLTKPDSAWSRGFAKYINGCSFRDVQGNAIDLHWRLYPENWDPSLNESFWQEAKAFNFRGLCAKTLRQEDLLLHIILHGSRRDPTPPFRWIADAYMLLKKKGDSFDWNFFCNRCQKLGVVFTVQASLECLLKQFDLKQVLTGINGLKACPRTRRDVLEYKINAKSGVFTQEIFFFWTRYRRIMKTHTDRLTFFELFRYLQYLARLDSLFVVPMHGFRKSIKLLERRS